MRPMTAVLALLCLTGVAQVGISSADAQGLLWTLPEDGTQVRYEGTYSQLVRRPNSTEGDLQLEWTRHLIIKSVGSEEAEYRGEVQPCRWIEIKVVTGQVKEGLIDAGPGGTRIYKMLVPEAAVDGQILDGEGILSAYVPIVKGWRKIGDEDPQAITSGVFQIYPTVSFLQHYRDLQPEAAAAEQVQIPTGFVNATPWKGKVAIENSTTRTTNEAQMWRSADVPFGLAKWTVRDVREEKHPTQSRDLFRETMEVSIEMSAHEVAGNAETELIVD